MGMLVGGRYRLRRLINVGGHGAVYEAQHEPLGTLHAIKETLTNDADTLNQFVYEAQLLAKLNHPVLVRVTDYFKEQSGAAFLVMDYVPGETLQHKLERPNASYTVSDVVSWLIQLCIGLEYLHGYRDPHTGQAHPIIHRDVKPLNIVLSPDGQIKLLDLGIARAAVQGQATSRAARSVTEPFAPIEQYGAGTDARSDLYALGVTAYVLFTRQLPPSAPERVAQPRKLSVRALNRAVPADIAAAVDRAMMPQAEARFESVSVFRQAIEMGWLAAGDGESRRERSRLWGMIQRAFVGTGGSRPQSLLDNGGLAEQLVTWRATHERRASIEVVLNYRSQASDDSRLSLIVQIVEHGPRGRETEQEIALGERDIRSLLVSLGELLHLRARLSAEFEFSVGRTVLRGAWIGTRGLLDLMIRTQGPRGGMKVCTIPLNRTHIESLVSALQSGMKRVGRN